MGGQFAQCHSLTGDFFRDVRYGKNQVLRRILGIEMNEIFQHGEGLVLGSTGEASAWTRPSPAVAISAFAIEGGARIGCAQHTKHCTQLMPP